jgi:hypothetical protein
MHSVHVIRHLIRDATHKCRESGGESQGLNAPPQLLLGGLIHLEAIRIIQSVIGTFGSAGEAINAIGNPVGNPLGNPPGNPLKRFRKSGNPAETLRKPSEMQKQNQIVPLRHRKVHSTWKKFSKSYEKKRVREKIITREGQNMKNIPEGDSKSTRGLS